MPPSPKDEKEPQAALPPRRQTFLARYPRHLKIGAVTAVAVLILVLAILPSEPKPKKTGPTTTPIAVAVNGQDARASIVNPGVTTNAYQMARDADSNGSAVPVAAATQGATDVAENENAFMTPAPDP